MSTPFFAVVIWVVLTAASIAVPLYLLYLGWRFLRAYEARTRSNGTNRDADLAARVALLEEQVQGMSDEMERVAEGQRFMNELVAVRERGDRLPHPRDERSVAGRGDDR